MDQRLVISTLAYAIKFLQSFFFFLNKTMIILFIIYILSCRAKTAILVYGEILE